MLGYIVKNQSGVYHNTTKGEGSQRKKLTDLYHIRVECHECLNKKEKKLERIIKL